MTNKIGNPRKQIPKGQAYAFFDCDASKTQIEGSMQEIRSYARTPQGLQMLLNEGISELKIDESLSEQIRYPDDYRVMSSVRFKQKHEIERKPLADISSKL